MGQHYPDPTDVCTPPKFWPTAYGVRKMKEIIAKDGLIVPILVTIDFTREERGRRLPPGREVGSLYRSELRDRTNRDRLDRGGSVMLGAIEEGVQYEEQAGKLLMMLQEWAPTGAEQAACSKSYNDMLADGVEPHQIVAQLAGSLADGLRYGNWPWTTNDMLAASEASLPTIPRGYMTKGHCKECDDYLSKQKD